MLGVVCVVRLWLRLPGGLQAASGLLSWRVQSRRPQYLSLETELSCHVVSRCRRSPLHLLDKIACVACRTTSATNVLPQQVAMPM